MAKSAKAALMMDERQGAELVKFDRISASIEGIFVGLTERDIEDSQTHEMKSVDIVTLAEVDDDLNLTGKEFEFIRAADMRGKVRVADRGKLMRVRYSSDMQTKNGKMKVFDVRVSREALIGKGASLGVSDSDIPF